MSSHHTNASSLPNVYYKSLVKDYKAKIKAISRLSELGLWNNSWVKNLPVRPLAPRRKTPGQLYPMFKGLLGWA